MDRGNTAKGFNLMFLGSHGGGKTTFQHQMDAYFNTSKINDAHFYTSIIYSTLQYAMHMYSELSQNGEIRVRAREVSNLLQSYVNTDEGQRRGDGVQQLVALWDSDAFQQDFAAQWDPRLLQAKYWLKTFVPTVRELLLNSQRPVTADEALPARIRTTGVIERRYSYGSTQVKAVQVAGRRAERRKWLHAFEDVSAILFFVPAHTLLVSQPDYGEDRDEVLELFAQLTKNAFLRHSACCLFITHLDLLHELVASADITAHLPSDYQGDKSVRSIVLYFVDKFWQQWPHKDRPLFVVCGTVVDRQATKLIIPYILQSLITSDTEAAQSLSGVVVDKERNIFIYIASLASTTYPRDIDAAVKDADPSPLIAMLQATADTRQTCTELLRTGQHSDLTLISGETRFPVHKLILAARAPDLLVLWTDNGTTNEVTVTDLNAATLPLLLEYVYTDQIRALQTNTASYETAITLLKFAEKFSWQPLLDYLCGVIADQMSVAKDTAHKEMNVEIVQELLAMSQSVNSDYLTLKCREYLLFQDAATDALQDLPRKSSLRKRRGCVVS